MRWLPFLGREVQPDQPTPPQRRLVRFLRRTVRFLALLAAVIVVCLLVWLAPALYHRWVTFPREEAAWLAIRAQRQPVAETAGWHEYRGILHSHSKLSHDCEVPFEEILGVLKQTGLDFICLSDHCVQERADFDWQWRGLHDGKLFIPGFEMRDGVMPFGVASGVVLSNRTDPKVLARQIVDNGGVLFYAHSEEPRAWEQPELTGMEIYNIHSDLKQQRQGLIMLLPDLLVNQARYPEHVFRLLFKRPTAFLALWDELNRGRHITGVAGNDCHQNTGLRVLCTATDQLRIGDTSPEHHRELKLGWITRPIARCLFGPLNPGRLLLHIQLDPYERSARFVNTHVLASELSEPAVLDSLRAGRVFIGFDMLADSTGFLWLATAEDGSVGSAVVGETTAFSSRTLLRALSPEPCRFTVYEDGNVVCQQEGRRLEWRPPGPGKYRVEAELNILNRWIPWVYANPIELK